MKNVLSGVLFLLSFWCGVTLESSIDRQLNFTNLVICNDIMENFVDDRFYQATDPVIMNELVEALLDHQLVLTTRSLWISIQNYYEFIINRRATKSFDPNKIKDKHFIAMLDRFIKKMKSVGFVDFTKEEKQQQEAIPKYILDAYTIYKFYHIFMTEQAYDCKEVSGDFILFIPKKLRSRHVATLSQDRAVGLAFNHLKDFDYAQQVPSQVQQNRRLYNYDLTSKHQLGERLLVALNKLKLVRKIPAENEPLFNVIITGHGTATQVTAEIAIQRKRGQQYNDFQRILNWFDSQVITKSLTIQSCYPGGKKVRDTFNIENKYLNSYLENISYPIINVGSSLAVTYGIFDAPYNLLRPQRQRRDGLGPQTSKVFERYFQELSVAFPDYSKAALIISGLYSAVDRKFVDSLINNYVSIKYPHTSWFKLVDFDKYVYFITPITGLIKRQQIIKDTVEIIVLEAAQTISPLILTGNRKRKNLPKILPVNNDKNAYIIDSIDLGNSVAVNQSSPVNCLSVRIEDMLVSGIQEQVMILIKELKATDRQSGKVIVYKNVCLFNHFMHQGKLSTGIIFTNEKNESFIDEITATQARPISTQVALAIARNIETVALQKDGKKISWQELINNAKKLLDLSKNKTGLKKLQVMRTVNSMRSAHQGHQQQIKERSLRVARCVDLVQVTYRKN